MLRALGVDGDAVGAVLALDGAGLDLLDERGDSESFDTADFSGDYIG